YETVEYPLPFTKLSTCVSVNLALISLACCDNVDVCVATVPLTVSTSDCSALLDIAVAFCDMVVVLVETLPLIVSTTDFSALLATLPAIVSTSVDSVLTVDSASLALLNAV